MCESEKKERVLARKLIQAQIFLTQKAQPLGAKLYQKTSTNAASSLPLQNTKKKSSPPSK
jgi:hypothetical protein